MTDPNATAIEFDPAKRALTLEHRGLDFADAPRIFEGLHFTGPDDRVDHGELRFITHGTLMGRQVIMLWTYRGTRRRIISMRKANEREQKRFRDALARFGRST